MKFLRHGFEKKVSKMCVLEEQKGEKYSGNPCAVEKIKHTQKLIQLFMKNDYQLQQSSQYMSVECEWMGIFVQLECGGGKANKLIIV